MILAIVSNVEDIDNSLIYINFFRSDGPCTNLPRGSPPAKPSSGKRSAARIPKRRVKFNGGGHLTGEGG
jgi:hypothetical protein